MNKERRTISEPERGEYKNHSVISLPLIDGDNKEGIPFTFGMRKAEAIVKYIDEIREFVDDENEKAGD